MTPSAVPPKLRPSGKPPGRIWFNVPLVRGFARATSVASTYGACDVPSPPPSVKSTSRTALRRTVALRITVPKPESSAFTSQVAGGRFATR